MKSRKTTHSFVADTYRIRLVYCYISIVPVISLFHQWNLPSVYWIVFSAMFLIWPHLAYFIAIRSHNPLEAELLFNTNVTAFIYGIWLPLVFFNPYILFSLITVVGAIGFIGGRLKPLVLIIVFLSLGAIVAGCFWGFQFKSDTNLITIISSCVTVFFSIVTVSSFNYRIIVKLSSTRKQLTEEKQKVEQALAARNEAYHQLNSELEQAAEYVRTMLPPPLEEGAIVTEWRFIPSASLGGDAFGYHWLDHDHFAVYLLDVSGHGVGAALLSVSVLNTLRSQSLTNTDFTEPKSVLTALNAAFPGEKNNDMFFSMWYGVYNFTNRNLIYASAGHPPALLLSNNEKRALLKTPNFVVGGNPDAVYQQETHLVGNDAELFIFSDGVYEMKRKDGAMWRFSEFDSFVSELLRNGHRSVDDVYAHTLRVKTEDPFEDDYTILKVVFKSEVHHDL